MMACEKRKILIIGATGYLGKYMLKASVSLGHPSYAYVRPIKPKTDSSKLLLHEEFEAMGATIFQGELDDHEKLVKGFEQVDVVISTVAVPQHLEQLKLIKAIKDAGNIKRFIPSEFGNEVDRISGLPPFEAILDNKRKIRRAIEAAGIPYTFVSANSFGAYFVDYLLHPREKTNHQVTVYGTGEAKAVLNYEEDVATYTIKAATDPRVANRVIVYRPQGNIVSQLDLISYWEKKTGCTLTRSYVPEEEIIKLSKTLPSPDNIRVSILHNIFIKGDQMSFELTENDLEASELYPDYKYTSIDSFLDICLVDPPKPKLAAFE
ncbi:isoeugenol synthase 1-like [Prunus avium]|uniref:Isoeugenol synthase 1-like n=1 Tax=Prunus avium TaxID=42229 RepID=A0A6P5SE35_PRUAV|nr:isoeugenol synthase 1-like [Prunus avium]